MSTTGKGPIDKVRARINEQIDDIVDGARGRANSAAKQIAKGKKPVNQLAHIGTRLTAVTQHTADRLLKQQAKALGHRIDAFAGRFSTAAKAKSLRHLLSSQWQLFPENSSRLIADTRDAFGIVVDGGTEVRDVFKDAVKELRGVKAPARKPAKKTAKKTARKTKPKAARKATPKTVKKAAPKAAQRAAVEVGKAA